MNTCERSTDWVWMHHVANSWWAQEQPLSINRIIYVSFLNEIFGILLTWHTISLIVSKKLRPHWLQYSIIPQNSWHQLHLKCMILVWQVSSCQQLSNCCTNVNSETRHTQKTILIRVNSELFSNKIKFIDSKKEYAKLNWIFLKIYDR